MKLYKKIYFVFSILLIAMGMLFLKEQDITGIMNASRYFVFLYTPLYFMLVYFGLEDVFSPVCLLRVNNRKYYIIQYMKKIVMHAIIYSSIYTFCLLFITIVQGDIVNASVGYYIALEIGQIICWIFVGILYFFFYIIFAQRNIALVISWLICMISGSSEHILFRDIGKYIYNVYDTATIDIFSLDYKIYFKALVIDILFIIILFTATLKIYEKKDILKRR